MPPISTSPRCTPDTATSQEISSLAARLKIMRVAGIAALGRHTSSSPLLREMDGLRVLALVLVVGLHYMDRLGIITHGSLVPNPATSMLNTVMQKGDFGVQLFFVISGFVLGLPFARQFLLAGRAVSPGRFYLRRLVRLQGPLLINLLILMAVLGPVLHKYPWSELLPQFLPTWGCWFRSTTGHLSLINPVAWSLEPELQFCLLMPLICRVFSLSNPWLRRGLLGLAILVPPYFKEGINVALLPAQIEYFMAGLLLADCYLMSWPQVDRQGHAGWTWLGLGSFISMIGLLAIRHEHGFFADMVMPWVAFAGMSSVLNSPMWRGFFAHPLLATIGGWCYTIYLYHILIIYGTLTVLFKVMPLKGLHAAFWGYLPVLILTVTVGCGILYVLTERPFINLASRLAKKRPGTPPAEPVAP